MVTQPLRILQAAVDIKKRRSSSGAVARLPANPVITELSVEELPQEFARINSTKLKQRAQAEYEKKHYEAALHNCRQALWFEPADHELLYLMALACYAVNDFKNAALHAAECLKANECFRPAITLQSILQREGTAEISYDTQCRARIIYLIYNRFDGYDKDLDGQHMHTYNAILDELLHDFIRQGDITNQLLIQHHKLRLNRIAEL